MKTGNHWKTDLPLYGICMEFLEFNLIKKKKKNYLIVIHKSGVTNFPIL